MYRPTNSLPAVPRRNPKYSQSAYKVVKHKPRKQQHHHSHPKPGGIPPELTDPTISPLIKYGLPDTPDVPVEGIDCIHIYDFDNTLFISPPPNYELYTSQSIEMLQNPSTIHSGGWWQDTRFIRAIGRGWDTEREAAWEGWWNEDIVELVRDSMANPRALTVLLTGRGLHFGPTIAEICASKGLKFDAIILKNPAFPRTLDFKTNVITDLLEWYRGVNDISVYEDRVWHQRKFKKFLIEYQQAMRKSLRYNVVLVVGLVKFLDPEVEIALLKQSIEEHNNAYSQRLLQYPNNHGLAMIDVHLFTGYVLKSQSRADLLNAYARLIPAAVRDTLKFHANAIVIRYIKASAKKTAHLKYGATYRWVATHFGQFNDEIWAVKVAPVVDETGNAAFQPLVETPMVILAHKKRTNGSYVASKIEEWIPLDSRVEIVTQVGDWNSKKIKKRQDL
ncbi:hypothetical protein DV495_002424 [Geotrichum candidum]|nr:hypothetical protein DV454_004478 [Geotrichum candidum]KAF5129262.1 hypothetical protein DV495_002424 [Geotrichum candidum]